MKLVPFYRRGGIRTLLFMLAHSLDFIAQRNESHIFLHVCLGCLYVQVKFSARYY